MSDTGELLEPFRPRSESVSNALFRRGSVIVIPSLDDCEDGLLETFQPRHGYDDTCDTPSVSRVCNGDINDTTPVQPSKVIHKGVEPVKQNGPTLIQLWQLLPSVPWRSSTAPTDAPNQVSASTSKELTIKKLEMLSQAMKETEDFRTLKEEMRSSGSLTTAGAHRARILKAGSKTPPLSPKRQPQPRRRSNSFPGFASKTFSNLSSSTHEKTYQPSTNANLSPFAINLDND